MTISLIKTKYQSPYDNIIKEIHKKEIKVNDYFKLNKLCYLGSRKPFFQYDGKIPDEDLVGWSIRKTDFLNLGVVAGSGIGKTRVIKNIISAYWKQGFKILIFCPKTDEWSSAKKKGSGVKLHHYSKNESLPVVNYCPSYVKAYMEQKGMSTNGYKFYSHRINTFRNKEIWETLGLSPGVSNFCVGLVKEGVKNLKDIQKKIKRSSLMSISKLSADNKIESLFGSEFINDRLNELDLKKEWAKENIISLNYFSQKGFLMSTDVWRVIEQIREYAQDNISKGEFQPILILFDDVNYYADKSKDYNKYSIGAILDCQVNFRRFGINNITAFQFPDVVASEIVQGSDQKLVSYLEKPNTLSGILPEEAIYILKANTENGGLMVDQRNYNIEWIWREKGREFYRFFPEDCKVGHD